MIIFTNNLLSETLFPPLRNRVNGDKKENQVMRKKERKTRERKSCISLLMVAIFTYNAYSSHKDRIDDQWKRTVLLQRY